MDELIESELKLKSNAPQAAYEKWNEMKLFNEARSCGICEIAFLFALFAAGGGYGRRAPWAPPKKREREEKKSNWTNGAEDMRVEWSEREEGSQLNKWKISEAKLEWLSGATSFFEWTEWSPRKRATPTKQALPFGLIGGIAFLFPLFWFVDLFFSFCVG